jgi:aspartyl-tRNA(Asn)/glutamyl-tRNA(Gln) amidotransferase subunit B
LLEIVSEPDLKSAEEAQQYLTELRKLVRYLDICDGNMEEGSMRCDANISVRLKGDTKLGNRCEVKNLNSIRNVQRAIDHEFLRQVEVIEAGGKIDQNTLDFDAHTGETSVLRSKEMANDYRYFPDPDLPPLVLTESYIDNIRKAMPALPTELYAKYTTQLDLSSYDASVITADKELAHYFESLIKLTSHYKSAANWLMGAVKSYLNEHSIHIQDFKLSPAHLAGLIALVDSNKVSNSIAVHKIFPVLVDHPEKTAGQVANELNLIIEEGAVDVQSFIKAALDAHPDKVKEYHHGKKGVLGLFMGEIMKQSKGKIDPKKTNQLLIEVLESYK